jgi:hypothetical protein
MAIWWWCVFTTCASVTVYTFTVCREGGGFVVSWPCLRSCECEDCEVIRSVGSDPVRFRGVGFTLVEECQKALLSKRKCCWYSSGEWDGLGQRCWQSRNVVFMGVSNSDRTSPFYVATRNRQSISPHHQSSGIKDPVDDVLLMLMWWLLKGL